MSLFLLNQLPAEIFHMIFGYLWAHEILHAFRNISDYLDRLLSNYKSYMINFKSIHKSHFDLICHHIQPEHVISLVLSDKLKTPNQSQLFRLIFSIAQFTHLRALKLIELDDDGQSFYSDLHKLQHLVSLEITVKFRLPLITTTPALQQLIINIPSSLRLNLDPSIARIRFEHLRVLSLSNCSCTQLKEIFRQATRLTSLKISFIFINPQEINTLANLHHGQSTIPALISLSLDITTYCGIITRVSIERFLAPLQRLQQLELDISFGGESDFLDADLWEIFITKHLSQLKIFNFKFYSENIDDDVLDQFRRPFWLDKQWFVAYHPDRSFLFTVPHFIPTEIHHSSTPIPSNCTTLPIEQHNLFYDRVTRLMFDSDQSKLPYRYNYVKKLILDCPYIQKNVLDLSKVQSFTVNNSNWSIYKIIILIKNTMPSVNYLSLACFYPSVYKRRSPNISLRQIRILRLPQYGELLNENSFNWSRMFPCVERLVASINSRRQISFLIDQFKNMASGFFYIHSDYLCSNKKIQVTRQWLKRHTHRLGRKYTNNFVCHINDKYIFSLCLWIGEDDEIDEEL